MPSQHPSNSLPRPFRLKRRSLIERLFDRSDDANQTVSHGGVRIVYRHDASIPADAPFQVAFAVGRKSGNAVDRNRIKRQMREAARHHASTLLDILAEKGDRVAFIMLYRGEGDRPNERIRRDAEAALERFEHRLAERAGNDA